MSITLTMAISDYAHTRDLVTGRVRAEGIDLNILSYPFEQVGLRFALGREFDISEFSLAGYCAHIAGSEAPDIVGLPIFPSRVFRQSGFYVNANAGIGTVSDLEGKRVGIPQWSQTAGVYARGYLQHQCGLPLSSIDWVQAGVNSPGRKEGAALHLPDGVRLTPVADRSLSEMLASGDVDAVISAREPQSSLQGHPNVRRLFENPEIVEEAFFKETGIFPIMHVMVMRRDIYERNRWAIRSLLDAFEEAKQNAIAAMFDATTSYLPVPWGATYMRNMYETVFADGDPWPYGVAANRVTLEAFLLYCHEQGVTQRRLTPAMLFPVECNYQVIV